VNKQSCLMSHRGTIYSNLDSGWKEARVFSVPTYELTILVKQKYREVGQEPYKEDTLSFQANLLLENFD